jgi:hypothetical protein
MPKKSYEIKAKATSYLGINFRSRTEAYAYEYFRTIYPNSIILYESKHYKYGYYTPDFIIGNHKLHIAIEVKPNFEKADFERYCTWMETFSCMDDFILWTPYGTLSVKYGDTQPTAISDFIYKSATNTVMFNLNQTGQK